jgi:flagellar basal-body rod modification protein FlgD
VLAPIERLVAAPNPFDVDTRIAFDLTRSARVAISVYDVSGRLVRAIDAGALAAGAQRVRWDGRGDDGAAAASGVYFLRAQADGTDPVSTRAVRLAR